MRAKLLSEALGDVLKPKSPRDMFNLVKTKDTIGEKISVLIQIFENHPDIFKQISEFRDEDDELNEVLMLLKISSLMKAGERNKVDKIIQEISDKYGRESLLTSANYLNSLIGTSWRSEDNIFSSRELEQLKLSLYKKTKSEDEEIRDEYMNSFLFLGYPDYVDVDVNGKIYKEERLGIENLIKVDLYNSADLQQAGMMKMRAGTVPGGRVYAVWVNKHMWGEEYAHNEQIPDDVREYIDNEKFIV